MAKKKAKKKTKKTTTKTPKTTQVVTLDTNIPSTGSYYIRKKQQGRSFTLYLKQYKNGKPITPHQKIDEAVFYRFGLSADMSASEAQVRLQEFRKLNKATRDDVAKQNRAFKRFAKSRTINQILFPQDLVAMFEQKIENENFGSEKHLQKKKYIFNTIQEIINELKLSPEIYNENNRRIFKYFADHQYSLNYCQKLIYMMNEWGKFATRKGSGYFKIIPQPKGEARQKIIKEAQNKTGVRKEAIPMTQELLNRIIGQAGVLEITERELNFFKATFYLGLRPDELIKTVNGGKHYTRVSHITGIDVVSIYQEKLQGVAEDKRTKHIPIKFPEQKNAIEIIEAQNFQKPTYKKIRKIAGALRCNYGNKILGLYSGRKGFVNWCFDKGEKSYVSVASWMGHLDPSLAYAVYRDRDKVLLGDSGESETPPKASGI